MNDKVELCYNVAYLLATLEVDFAIQATDELVITNQNYKRKTKKESKVIVKKEGRAFKGKSKVFFETLYKTLQQMNIGEITRVMVPEIVKAETIQKRVPMFGRELEKVFKTQVDMQRTSVFVKRVS